MIPRIIRFLPGGGKAPAILSACQESRNEARKKYRLCIYFFENYAGPMVKGYSYKIPDFGVFINYDVDIIHFTQQCIIYDGTGCNKLDQLYHLPRRAREVSSNTEGQNYAWFNFSLWTV